MKNIKKYGCDKCFWLIVMMFLEIILLIITNIRKIELISKSASPPILRYTGGLGDVTPCIIFIVIVII